MIRRFFALAVLSLGALSYAQVDALAGSMKGKVKVQPVVELKQRPFALDRVRLLDGPFKKAQDADHAYLLTVDPLRLLHGFYQNAGLPVRGEAYGGWEQMDIAGHSLGHYLTACSEMYAATGDAKLREKVDLAVGELAKCQEAHKDGMVAGFPQADRVWAEIKRGEIKSQPFNLNGIWVPWYNEHKLLDGLIAAYLYCDSSSALSVATKLGDWAIEETKALTPEQWQAMLGTEHGGMNEVLANLYGITGEKKYLELAMKFHHERVLGPLERGERKLTGLHGNTNIPKVIGCAREYELDGSARYKDIAESFWHEVVEDHTYVSGGNTMGEYFGPPKQLAARIGSNTTETCNTFNMLKLTQHLMCVAPSSALGEFYERALWNHILASVNPDQYGVTYFLPLGMGVRKSFSGPFDNFTCCHGSGMENHAKYGGAIYYESGDVLAIDQFISSELDWKEMGVKVTVKAQVSGPAGMEVTFSMGEPKTFTLRVRTPHWRSDASGDGAVYWVPDGSSARGVRPGEEIVVRRTWRSGETIRIGWPLDVRTEPIPGDERRVALLYGPVVLAAVWDEPTADYGLPPTFVDANASTLLAVDEHELDADTFSSAGSLKPGDLKFLPLYQVHGERYSVYFDEKTGAEWAQLVEAHRAEVARQKELESRTVDFADVGSQRAMRDRNFKSSNSFAGTLNERRWRDARDGGFFEFDVKVDGGGPNQLMLTYWGSDGGNRSFDIMVDGRVVATQRLTAEKQGQFIEVVYDVPVELTQGKEKAVVRVQAKPGSMAGGVFGVRVLRPKP